MNEKKNGQAVTSNAAGQPEKGKDGTMPNPKNEINTPDKTQSDLTTKPGIINNKNTPQSNQTVKPESNSNKNTPSNLGDQPNEKNKSNVPEKDGNAPEKRNISIKNENKDVDEDRDMEEESVQKEISVGEQKKDMPISFE